MPLVGLVTITENNKENFSIHSVLKYHKKVSASEMLSYFEDVAKQEYDHINIGNKEKFKEEDMVVYVRKINNPKLAFFAFTVQNYSANYAYKCLENYEKLFKRNVLPERYQNIEKDQKFSVKNDKTLIKSFHLEAQAILYDQKEKKMSGILDRAQQNLENYKNLNDQTDMMRLNASDINEQAEQLRDDSVGKKKKKKMCEIF